ncbi:MbtH family NRPS accessory protein [Paenibacillus sp. LMG 31461]|uniref:MbtH family NRPS accessory protein n=1 Tax=Paenibacillus plantarum TaxID=2654975 RepID=A0ABX1X3W4_9BACL|nr:MbtH family NRPS accessory protein [Paenibacillus plantarum]NOU63103.1 MbtH family NRPS accessory protein [Paenibacillus plantarum]
MSNPFEEKDDAFVVLINELGQYSLWPAFALVPAGWMQVFGLDREACLAYIESHWTDMRPQQASERKSEVTAGERG